MSLERLNRRGSSRSPSPNRSRSDLMDEEERDPRRRHARRDSRSPSPSTTTRTSPRSSSSFSSSSDYSTAPSESTVRRSVEDFDDERSTITDDMDEIDEFCADNFVSLAMAMPLNVLQLLISLRESETRLRHLKSEQRALSLESDNKANYMYEDSSEMVSIVSDELARLNDSILKESVDVIVLYQVLYGDFHWKLARAYANLAQVYLEHARLPTQARAYCERAWQVLINGMQEDALGGVAQTSGKTTVAVLNPDESRDQMQLNYVYGKACTLLKDNEEGEKALEKALDHYRAWVADLKDKRRMSKSGDTRVKRMSTRRRLQLTKEIREWKIKILIALSKQYGINKNYAVALQYYDQATTKLINQIDRQDRRLLHKQQEDQCLLSRDELTLIQVFEDKAIIEQNREIYKSAIDLIKSAILIADKKQASVIRAELKLKLALIYGLLDDVSSTSHSDKYFQECLDEFNIIPGCKERVLRAKEELAKNCVKQERYEDAKRSLYDVLDEQSTFYGDYSLRVNTTCKLLCSILLKMGDMPNAAKYLHRSLDIETMNYGPKYKQTLETQETLNTLIKNPNVQFKLKILPKEHPDTKKVFHSSIKKTDYIKTDKMLYQQKSLAGATAAPGATSNDGITDLAAKQINPVK